MSAVNEFSLIESIGLKKIRALILNRKSVYYAGAKDPVMVFCSACEFANTIILANHEEVCYSSMFCIGILRSLEFCVIERRARKYLQANKNMIANCSPLDIQRAV